MKFSWDLEENSQVIRFVNLTFQARFMSVSDYIRALSHEWDFMGDTKILISKKC